jgi:hypothetical protein
MKKILERTGSTEKISSKYLQLHPEKLYSLLPFGTKTRSTIFKKMTQNHVVFLQEVNQVTKMSCVAAGLRLK